MHLPYELAELILCQVASVGDAFHLARSSYSFWEVWNNPVSRHRICYEIVLKNLPCLIQFEQLAEAQLASCYRFHNELQSITERASLIGRNADSAKKAMESFELHALRRISRGKNVWSTQSLRYSTNQQQQQRQQQHPLTRRSLAD